MFFDTLQFFMRLTLSRWLTLLIVLALLLAFPISYDFTRVAEAVLLIALWLGLLVLLRQRLLRIIVLVVPMLGVLSLLLLDHAPADRTRLREAVVQSLRQYEGTRYIWGGENALGIDCSGLVRRGMMNALFKQGVLELRPVLIRQAFSLWWHDCSAKALRDGYRGLTTPLFEVGQLDQVESSRLQPGDLALTADGLHVLAYLGGNEWINADPLAQKTVIIHTPAPKNAWFHQPMKLRRWTALADGHEK